MLNAWRTRSTHEDIFVQRYGRMLNWALQLTGYDQQQAEDLVHDAFIQFTHARPELSSIQNLDGYLYTTLRNMHVSQVRRAVRNRTLPLSVVDYDSAEATLRATDDRRQIQVKDELRAICHYACIRKDTSKSGSVLILRFFHGYYPSEIAQIMLSPRRAADDWMRIARREAKVFVDNPGCLEFLRKDPIPSSCDPGSDPNSRTFLSELRSTIFRSRSGKCLTQARLKQMYEAGEPTPLDSATLAHTVSCEECLDSANRYLGFPPLSGRFPNDVIGSEAQSRQQKNGNGRKKVHDRIDLRGRVREIREHHPKELHLSANGFIIGSQTVASELSEQTLSVNLGEKIGFVEVFSEQGVRLLFADVEPPPDGPVTRVASVQLSEGRTLALHLSFSETWPLARISYHDPMLAANQVELDVPDESATLEPTQTTLVRTGDSIASSAYSRIRDLLAPLKYILRPGVLTSIGAVVLIVALLLPRLLAPPVSAAELLGRARQAEEARAIRSDQVVHRILAFEERHAEEGTLISKRRVEIWNTATNARARRVYDEQGGLIAAEWQNEEGSQTIYRRGAKPQPVTPSNGQDASEIASGDVWRLEPSARDFASLIGNVETTSVEEQRGAYFLSYRASLEDANRSVATGKPTVIRATLRLNRSDLHALELTLWVRRADTDSTLVQYRLTESNFEQRPVKSVAPEVFRPEPELVNPPASRQGRAGSGWVGDHAPARHDPVPLSEAALAQLEVEALYQIHRIGACLRERVSLGRTADGELQVQAIVDNDQRKAEMGRALSAIADVPGVRLELTTVAEALSRQLRLPAPATVSRRVEIMKVQIPAFADLRRYYSGKLESDPRSAYGRGSTDSIDEKVRGFARQAISRSRQALLHAWSLKRLVEQVPPETLRILDGDGQAKWRSIVRDHARSLQTESEALRLELQPVFFASLPPRDEKDSSAAAVASDLTRTIGRLLDLASENDQVVRLAFTVSPEAATTSAIKSAQFRDSLGVVEELAALIRGLN